MYDLQHLQYPKYHVRCDNAHPEGLLHKDDVISFRDTPLAEVLETLSRWYDVRFETDGQPDRPISYTFATDNTLLDNVLREMELISPVRFERTKTEIKVSFR